LPLRGASDRAAKAADALLPQPWGQLPPKTSGAQPTTRFDWAGLYVGGHVGYGRGAAEVVLTDPNTTSFSSSFGTLVGGVQVGYNFVLPSRVLLGIEADMSFPPPRSTSSGSPHGLFCQTELFGKYNLQDPGNSNFGRYQYNEKDVRGRDAAFSLKLVIFD
jgi:hypothetical protein